MSMYRKKPVVIEARQLTDKADWDEIAAWCGGKLVNHAPVPGMDPETRLHISTLEGVMRACEGDWVIRGVAGEFYPCAPSIFSATYEPA